MTRDDLRSITLVKRKSFASGGSILALLLMKPRVHDRSSRVRLESNPTRFTTPMKTIRGLSIVILTVWMTLNATAAMVRFDFSGVVTHISDYSNAVPGSITYDTPMSGSLSYDPSTIRNGIDYNPSPNSGSYYFSSDGVFSISVKIGPHTFSNLTHTTEFPYASIIVHNDYLGDDRFTAEDGSPYVVMDGGAFLGDCDDSYISFDFVDNTGTAFDSDALPLAPIELSRFSNRHTVNVFGLKNENMVFNITATITNIDGVLPPKLKMHAQPDRTVKLSWPLAAEGFKLLQTTNLTTGIGWTTNTAAIVDTASEHTVTLPASDGAMFFRLKN
jgi:hypothetical protein